MPTNTSSANRLLAALPSKIFKQIEPKLERVELVYNTDIYAAGDVIKHIYFPEGGIVSLLAVVGQDSTLEVGIVGREGMVGISVFLGEPKTNTRAVVQGPGIAMRMTAKDLLVESERSDELARILKRFAASLMTQISQSAACNRYHPIESRLARWLLMTRDRMRSDEFQITQEFLANMVGVRREAVNKAAHGFNEKGLISYVRGHVTVRDAAELERLACPCYAITREVSISAAKRPKDNSQT